MKKRYVISIIIVFITALSFFAYNKFSQREKININSGIAIYLQDENNEDNYVLSNLNTIPTDGYIFNVEKTNSLCNGATFSFDESYNNISVSTAKHIKCNMYFDLNNFIKVNDIISSVNNNCSFVVDSNDSSLAKINGAATTNEGLCSMEDGTYGGTTYFYRGAVNNNWVKFAGIYWRIIKYNGDKSIKMIYSGTTAPTASTSSIMTGSNTQIGVSLFNESYTDTTYVGYMYGSAGQTTYAATHANEHNSKIKDVLDNWFYENLQNGYRSFISDDAGFCGDREVNFLIHSSYTGHGYGNDQTAYSPWYRADNNLFSTKCTQINNDLYTPTTSKIGNKKLIYPVGLISSDEVIAAGAISSVNTNYYLYTNQDYWTMSPHRYYNWHYSTAVVMDVSNDGKIYANYLGGNYSIGAIGVRPVINLKPGTKFKNTTDGTWNNPYKVVGTVD